MYKLINTILFISAFLLLASCGGGGSSSPAPDTETSSNWDEMNWDQNNWQ